jgi:hypothetical protein
MRGLLSELKAPGRRIVVLGDPPELQQDGPICLAAHESDATACSSPISVAVAPYEERTQAAAAKAVGGKYVSIVPWLCTATTCPAVIGKYDVYEDPWHLSSSYADFLGPVVVQSIGLS